MSVNKFDFGSFSATPDAEVFTVAKNYTNPTSETQTRKELSFPLSELKNYINTKIFDEDEVNAVINVDLIPEATNSTKGVVIVDSALNSSSTNPVQNKAVHADSQTIRYLINQLEGRIGTLDCWGEHNYTITNVEYSRQGKTDEFELIITYVDDDDVEHYVSVPAMEEFVYICNDELVFDLGALTVVGGAFTPSASQKLKAKTAWEDSDISVIKCTVNGVKYIAHKQEKVTISGTTYYAFSGSVGYVSGGMQHTGTVVIGVSDSGLGIYGVVPNLDMDDISTSLPYYGYIKPQSAPTTDGTYVLKAVRSGGITTYQWVAE